MKQKERLPCNEQLIKIRPTWMKNAPAIIVPVFGQHGDLGYRKMKAREKTLQRIGKT